MEIVRAVKGQIYTTKTKYKMLDDTLYACNYIYNHMLERQQKSYERRGEHLSFYDMVNLLPVMKKYNTWLKDADSQGLMYACRQVDTAYQKFFKHEAGYPKFHSRRSGLSYTTAQHIKVLDKGVRLPKVGELKVRGLRRLPNNAKICFATVSRETDGKYYVSITYKYNVDIDTPKLDETKFIGVHYTSHGLYASSGEEIMQMPSYFRESQAKLAKAQRKLAKKQGNLKGQKKSSGWIKQQKKVLKIHKHIANQRKDYLHKKSKYLADTYSGISVEDIDMRSLSSKGFKNGKVIYDNGFGEFRRQLEYKLSAQGKPFVKVDKWFPTIQICSCCGHQNKELKNLRAKEWICPKCGSKLDRNINASINVRNEGLKMLV